MCLNYLSTPAILETSLLFFPTISHHFDATPPQKICLQPQHQSICGFKKCRPPKFFASLLHSAEEWAETLGVPAIIGPTMTTGANPASVLSVA